MPDWTQGALTKLTGLGSTTSSKRVMISFAKEHKLTYFGSVDPDGQPLPVIRGTTAGPDQVDMNYCLGSHADYDVALVERMVSVGFDGYKTTVHKWYVLEIDLHVTVPYMFIGTRQQTKAYYARVLSSHRELRYLTLNSSADHAAAFHGHYAVMASPADTPVLYRLFDDETIDTLGAHMYPFAMEFDSDSLSIITEAKKPNQQLLTKLLHYGLWLAKETDQRLGSSRE